MVESGPGRLKIPRFLCRHMRIVSRSDSCLWEDDPPRCHNWSSCWTTSSAKSSFSNCWQHTSSVLDVTYSIGSGPGLWRIYLEASSRYFPEVCCVIFSDLYMILEASAPFVGGTAWHQQRQRGKIRSAFCYQFAGEIIAGKWLSCVSKISYQRWEGKKFWCIASWKCLSLSKLPRT